MWEDKVIYVLAPIQGIVLIWFVFKYRAEIEFRREHALGLWDIIEKHKNENKDLRKEISYLKQMAGELKERG